MWWTVDHVASNQQSVESKGGGGWLFTLCIDMHCVTLAIFVFPHLYLYLSSSALVFCTSCLYDYCSVYFPLLLL